MNMKKLILLIAIALFSQSMIAQASTVTPPPAVTTAFAARFPNVQVREWKEQEGTYYANFRLNGKKTFAYYTADGSWKGTETPLKWSWHLPAKVRNAWKNSDFAAWYLMDIKKIETPDGPLYALHVNNSPLLDSDHAQIDHDEYEIFFNEKGELVRKDAK